MKTTLGWTPSRSAIAPAFLFALALATGALLAAPAARAQDPGDFDEAPMHDMHGGGGRGHGHGRMGMGMRGFGPEMAEKLKLTDKQKTQMADLREAQERKMIGINSGLAEARLDLEKLMRAETPSQSQIDATIDRMAKLRADASKSRIATRLAMRGLLTDSQKKTMEEMKGEMRSERRGARGSRGGSGSSSGGSNSGKGA